MHSPQMHILPPVLSARKNAGLQVATVHEHLPEEGSRAEGCNLFLPKVAHFRAVQTIFHHLCPQEDSQEQPQASDAVNPRRHRQKRS
jgi:hypothetical protein